MINSLLDSFMWVIYGFVDLFTLKKGEVGMGENSEYGSKKQSQISCALLIISMGALCNII